MSAHTFRVSLIFLSIAVSPSSRAMEVSEPARQEARSNEGTQSGYRKLQALESVVEALAAGRHEEALYTTTEILSKPDENFADSREARVTKAHAFLLRADARLGVQADAELVLQDEKAAAALGLQKAAYRAAARLTIQASVSPLQKTRLLANAETYYRKAAELGDTIAMDILSDVILRSRGEDAERMYWSFQVRLSRSPAEIRQVVAQLRHVFDTSDTEYLERVLTRYSLSGGVLSSNVSGVPGRSYLATFLNDLLLRRQLNFVWSAFYQDDAAPENRSTTLASYQALRNAIPDTPFADLYLLVAGRTRETDPRIISTSRALIARAMSPGDQVVVRCGPIAHQATLWSVDRPSGTAYILDPFYEFWMPSHNSCVKRFSRVEYRHQRKLVRVSLAELEPMLTAVMTLRDTSANTARREDVNDPPSTSGKDAIQP